MKPVNVLKSSKRLRPGVGSTAAAPLRFASLDRFRDWLRRHHASVSEAWLVFHRKGTGTVGLNYDATVEVALCFGWIDGVRKKLDDTRYVNRFTPRKPGSNWSLVNIARVERLQAAGLMHEAGLRAFAQRHPARTGVYSFEQRPETFPAALEQAFRRHRLAWAHFLAQPPGYRRLAIWYVVSAKREETRQRRLAQLIAVSADGQRLGVLFGQTGGVPTPSRAKSVARSGAVSTKARSPAAGASGRLSSNAPHVRATADRRATRGKQA